MSIARGCLVAVTTVAVVTFGGVVVCCAGLLYFISTAPPVGTTGKSSVAGGNARSLEVAPTVKPVDKPVKDLDDWQNARLAMEGQSIVLVAVNQESYDALIEASVADDARGIALLVLAGDLFEVSKGTRVKILDAGFFTSKVRIMSGSHEGRSGIVATEWIDR